ncbi:hypothetical protein [Microbacterium sp.]|uniref:hypothetical protein n=1 Tax=Microbacterium sp. TaxID=51671 RepID=UPI0039E68B93
MKKYRLIVTAAAALFLLGIAAPPAMAATTVAPEIQAVLDEVPGGVVVDYFHAEWPDRHMSMSIEMTLTVGSCATGTYCAYNTAGLTGTKLSWTTCTTQTLPTSFILRSFANGRTSGTVQARNGTTVVATVGASAWANVTATTTNLRCS